MTPVRIIKASPNDPAAVRLLDALSDTLSAITGDDGRASFDPAQTDEPGSVFLLALDEAGEPLGCGALRPLAGGTGEIKRMYAAPGTKGVGAALLAALEAEAERLDYSALKLSTRRVNHRAIDFYRRQGWSETDPFGRYIGRPESVCMAKVISPR
jgi:GNAT superfamily N-acetyltransferase